MYQHWELPKDCFPFLVHNVNYLFTRHLMVNRNRRLDLSPVGLYQSWYKAMLAGFLTILESQSAQIYCKMDRLVLG